MLFAKEGLRVLAIGAHPDDLELGLGGIMTRLIREYKARIHFLVLTAGTQHWLPRERLSRADRVREANDAAATLGVPRDEVEVLSFEDCKLHERVHELIEAITARLFDEQGQAQFDLVLTHAKGDIHNDHEQTSRSTMSAVRAFDGTVLFYQSVSTIPNEFRPTFFVRLDEETVKRKDAALMKHISQRDKDFMQYARTSGMAKSWALFYRKPDHFFEAFEVYKSFW